MLYALFSIITLFLVASSVASDSLAFSDPKLFALGDPRMAQTRKPDWVENFDAYTKYPKENYLAGFGTSTGTDSDALEVAKDNARADLSRTIVVGIRALLRIFKEEINQELSQHFTSLTESSTPFQEIIGLGTDTYRDNAPPTMYALAYASKEDLRRIYSKMESELRDEIKEIIADAQAAESNSRSMEAAAKYLSLYPLYDELQKTKTILLVVGELESQTVREEQIAHIEHTFAELHGEVGESSPDLSEVPLMSWTEVANRIDQLLSQSLESVDDVARSVVIQLSKQAGDLDGRLLIAPFTYQDTKMSGPFARYFRSALENQIGLMTGSKWDAVSEARGFQPKSVQITRDLTKESGAQWLLSGTYWEQGDKIKLMANLRDVDTGKMLAGADVLFDADILKSSGLNPKPQNFEQALIEQNAFTEGEVVSGQLHVDVWTNKGNESLLFTEGEIMKVYVRVNRPAYVRLLYILANGRRTLLPIDPNQSGIYDNYYIDQSKVNRVVEIPAEFECAPPFGAEMLVAIARTEELEPLEIEEVDGYYYLEADSPKEAAAEARGMKWKKQEVQQTEAKIVVTTMEE